MRPGQNRAWAEISLSAIEQNYRNICAHAKAPVMCVVKADAYGHGAVAVAQRLAPLAPYFAVATLEEGLELRENGIQKPILLLGFLPIDDMGRAIENDITVTVYEEQMAEPLSEAAQRLHRQAAIHFKLDTGMTRLGFAASSTDETAACLERIARLPNIQAEGIFTHFAVADTLEGFAYTDLQYQRFADVCRTLEKRGITLKLRHCANSGAISQHENMHCNMTRAGIILYGYRPDADVPVTPDIHPAMTVKTHIAQIRTVDAGATVGYGRAFTAPKRMKIAVLAMGYADGLHRICSGKIQALIHGKRVDLIGRICMDMCMVEIPDGLEAKIGDEAVIMDTDKLTADDLARAAGTISYEMLCAWTGRIPKIYLD